MDAGRVMRDHGVMARDTDSSRTRDGITTRHQRQCPAYQRSTAVCRCTPTYQVQVWSTAEQKRKSRTFPTWAAARNWRDDARVEIRRGTMVIGDAPTLRAAWHECERLMRAGVITTRSGDEYKPSAIRSYDRAMRLRLLPELGALPLNEIRSTFLVKLIKRWRGDGLSPSTVHNTINPLRVIFRQAIAEGDVSVNPTAGLKLPAVRGKRERFATPAEAAILIGLVPEEDRAIWATAFYSGQRRSELLADEWDRNVDLDGGVFLVTNGYDLEEHGEVAPKSEAGTRKIPIVKQLRPYLVRHALLTGRRQGLIFGRDAEHPFTPSWIQKRADRAWEAAEQARQDAIEAGEVDPETSQPIRRITLHECRHTFASMMIAAQVAAGEFNPKVLQKLMGHASIQITYDRYGHLFPGSEAAAGEVLERYLEAVDG